MILRSIKGLSKVHRRSNGGPLRVSELKDSELKDSELKDSEPKDSDFKDSELKDSELKDSELRETQESIFSEVLGFPMNYPKVVVMMI